MNRIKELRMQKGLTQKELSRLLFYSVGAVSHWEKGVNLSDDVIEKLCQFFDVSKDYLLNQAPDVDSEFDLNSRFEKLSIYIMENFRNMNYRNMDELKNRTRDLYEWICMEIGRR